MPVKKKRKRVKNLTARQLVARLEQRIAEAELMLSKVEPGKANRIPLRIIELKHQLQIAKGHVISKLDCVRHRVVDGCYGAGKRR